MAASPKIDPLSVITQHTPTPESPKSASSWFKTERMELDFGDYVGRPSENVTAHKEALTALLADGWYVTAVSNGGSDGEWKRVSSQKKDGTEGVVGHSHGKANDLSTSEQTDSTKSVSEQESHAQSESHAEAHQFSSSQNSHNTFTNGTRNSGATSGGGNSFGSTESNSGNDSNGSSSNSGTTKEYSDGGSASGKEESVRKTEEETSQDSTSHDEVSAEESDPYWCAWQKIRLERRRMQAELVLQSMVDTFVANFNEGRQINVDRYEELVALYALMVSQTQDDAANIDLDSIDFEPLFDEVKEAITEKLSQYQGIADQIPSDWLESRKADINLKFNNLIGEARAKMVSDGTYNGTVWPSVEAGIEHQRSHALDALKDEAVTLKLSAYGDIAKTTAALYGQMIDAQVRVFEALKSKKTTPITLRNEVLKWMYDFMERRTDDHVKIEELATLVQQMGYDGGIVAPASVSS